MRRYSNGKSIKSASYSPTVATRTKHKGSSGIRSRCMVMMGTGTMSTPSSANPALAGYSVMQYARDRVQVCRTQEEKERSPEIIRLDKSGLRIFPEIGGGETLTLKLLSLQHNLINRLDNAPLLSQLVVLDLYDNRVERITGLQGLLSLRVLILGKNRIRRIEGLDGLKRLEILDLHGNQLRYVDNLGSLSALRVLNLAGNLLRNIRNLGPNGLPSLTELNLKRNRIKNLDGLQKAPHLKKLFIANNEIQSFATLVPLRTLVYLHELVVDPNPLCSVLETEYKSQALALFPRLHTLDRCSITEEMRNQAKLWLQRKLAEEEARKQEDVRLREKMNLTLRPPGSREQIIHEARCRWESLRNYVKASNSKHCPDHDQNPTASDSQYFTTLHSTQTTVKELGPNIGSHCSTEIRPPNFKQLSQWVSLDQESLHEGHYQLDNMDSLLSNMSNIAHCTKHTNKRIINGSEVNVNTQSDMINGSQQLNQTSILTPPNLSSLTIEKTAADCGVSFVKPQCTPVASVSKFDPYSDQQQKLGLHETSNGDKDSTSMPVLSNETQIIQLVENEGKYKRSDIMVHENKRGYTQKRKLTVFCEMTMGGKTDKNEKQNDEMLYPLCSSPSTSQELKIVMLENAMDSSCQDAARIRTKSSADSRAVDIERGLEMEKQHTKSTTSINDESISPKKGSSILDALSFSMESENDKVCSAIGKVIEEQVTSVEDSTEEDGEIEVNEKCVSSGLEIQSLTETSSRIAVVRPLIRVVNFDETNCHQTLNTNPSLPFPKLISELRQSCSSREDNVMQAQTNMTCNNSFSLQASPTFHDKEKYMSGMACDAETSSISLPSYFATRDLVFNGESDANSPQVQIPITKSIFHTDHQHHPCTMNCNVQMREVNNRGDDVLGNSLAGDFNDNKLRNSNKNSSVSVSVEEVSKPNNSSTYQNEKLSADVNSLELITPPLVQDGKGSINTDFSNKYIKNTPHYDNHIYEFKPNQISDHEITKWNEPEPKFPFHSLFLDMDTIIGKSTEATWFFGTLLE